MNSASNREQANRSALLDKISALLAKTKERGCTEAESMAAAEVAARLMAKHGLSLAELQAIPLPSNACDADGVPIGNQRTHPVRRVANAIAHYTDTRTWWNLHGCIHGKPGTIRRVHPHNGPILIFFGLSADVQVALYLTQTLRIAMDTEWVTYWATNRKTNTIASNTARASFMGAMAHRLSERLYAMKRAQGQEASESRALVVVKKGVVDAAYADLEPSFKVHRARHFRADMASAQAGLQAADRTTIARGAIEEQIARGFIE